MMIDKQVDEKIEYVAADDRIIGVAFKWSIIVFVILAAIAGVIVLVVSTKEPEPVVVDNGQVQAL